MAKEYVMTKDGYDELLKKVEYYETVKRKEASERIKEARSYGDLSENAEYDSAKEAQALVEAEIITMRHQLENAEIIVEPKGKAKKVMLGSKVTILDDGDECVYTIVGITEANIMQGKISNESPLAKAILGKSVGTVCQVNAGETYEVKIISID